MQWNKGTWGLWAGNPITCCQLLYWNVKTTAVLMKQLITDIRNENHFWFTSTIRMFLKIIAFILIDGKDIFGFLLCTTTKCTWLLGGFSYSFPQ